jgi:hypothetical protein
MNPETTDWKCPNGHVMGVVTRNGSGVRVMLMYRNSVNPSLNPSPSQGEGEGGNEVEVAAVIEGYAADVKCSVCGRMRTWVPGEEALMKLLEQARRER